MKRNDIEFPGPMLMKNLVRFTLIVSLLVTCLSANAFASPAVKVPNGWLNGAASFERAMQLQKELNVPLVVYFYVDWCPYCHALEREYFPSAPVRQYLDSVVKIKINPELSRADHELGNAFGVRGYPSFFVIAPNSFPIKLSPFRGDGRNLTPTEFAQRCRDVATPRATALPPKATAASPIADAPVSAAAAPKFVSNAPLPTADAVLSRYARITGEALANRVTSRVIKGRVEAPALGFSGRFELYSIADGRSMTVTTVQRMGTLRQGFDGTSRWSLKENVAPGVKLPDVPILSEADLFSDIRLSNLYSRTKLMGKVQEGDREVYLVEGTPRKGATEKLYFDTENGMLLHRDLTRSTSRGTFPAEIYFSNWRRLDGFLLPCSLTHVVGSLTVVFTIEEIKHNVAIDDAVFQRPANAVAAR